MTYMKWSAFLRSPLDNATNILCFIIGPVLITYTFFDFSVSHRSDIPYYYYKEDTQILIALGVALVCWGFLRHYWKKNNGTRTN